MNGIIALLGALGSFFFFGFLFSEPSPSLALGFLFTGGFELLASFLDDFWRKKKDKEQVIIAYLNSHFRLATENKKSSYLVLTTTFTSI
jgi:hypothetical protein